MKHSLDLTAATRPEWVQAVMANFPAFLQDHADCERKASAMAMSFVAKYPDRVEIIPELIETGIEELQHFQQVYAHMQKRFVEVDEPVKKGQRIGAIGVKNTPENGWWEEEHLHFGIYTGMWDGKVLPGYWTPGSSRTHKEDWVKPSDFINDFPINKGSLGEKA